MVVVRLELLMVFDLVVVKVEVGKPGVALDLGMDNGQVQTLGPFQRVLIDAGTAGDKYGFDPEGAGELDRAVERIRVQKLRTAASRRTGQDDVETPGQRATDRLVGAAPHDNRVTHRQLLEAAQIGGQVPRQIAVFADDAVLAQGSDHRDRRRLLRGAHTATAARMCGCGS